MFWFIFCLVSFRGNTSGNHRFLMIVCEISPKFELLFQLIRDYVSHFTQHLIGKWPAISNYPKTFGKLMLLRSHVIFRGEVAQQFDNVVSEPIYCFWWWCVAAKFLPNRNSSVLHSWEEEEAQPRNNIVTSGKFAPKKEEERTACKGATLLCSNCQLSSDSPAPLFTKTISSTAIEFVGLRAPTKEWEWVIETAAQVCKFVWNFNGV